MKAKHVQIYLEYFNVGETDTWQCEACTIQLPINNGLNIHHINGRGPDKDVINNLMCLCVKCHARAHGDKNYVSKSEFQLIHGYFLAGARKCFLQ